MSDRMTVGDLVRLIDANRDVRITFASSGEQTVSIIAHRTEEGTGGYSTTVHVSLGAVDDAIADIPGIMVRRSIEALQPMKAG